MSVADCSGVSLASFSAFSVAFSFVGAILDTIYCEIERSAVERVRYEGVRKK